MASIYDWSVTASSNANADSDINWAEGMLPGLVNNSARAMMAKVASFTKALKAGYLTTNSGNAYSVALDFGPASLATKGFVGVLRFNAANTGAATLQIDALSPVDLRNAQGSALSSGQIAAGSLHVCVYDSGNAYVRILTIGGVLSSTDIGDFTEAVQDIIGALFADSSSLDFTYNDVSNSFAAVVLPGGVNHDALLNFVANKHIDHTAVSMGTAAGTSGLSGGGDLSATRALVVDITGLTSKFPVAVADEIMFWDTAGTARKKGTLGGMMSVINVLTEDTTPDSANDFVATWDASASAAKKVKLTNLVSATGIATAAEIAAGTNNTKMITPNALALAGNLVALTDGATVTVDLTTGINFSLAIAGNRTLAFSGISATLVGNSGFIKVTQDATGNRTLDMTAASILNAGGTNLALSTAANAVDIIYYTIVSATQVLTSITKGIA